MQTAFRLAATLAWIFLSQPASAGPDLPPDTRVMADLAYGSAPEQRLDVYLPPGLVRAPVIVMVHGGAWAFGDKAHDRVVENKAGHWLPLGYVLVSVNNRLLPDADPLEQADDVARAVAFIQANAAAWGGDPGRIVLMGHSAGGHLVALLSAAPEIGARHGVKPWRGTVVLDSAVFDVVRIMEAPRHPRLYDRAFGEDPAFWRQASPLHRLNGRPVPLLLACSSPRALSCAQAHGFARKVKDQGGTAEVLPLDMSHGEINADLGLAGAYTQAVDAFFNRIGMMGN